MGYKQLLRSPDGIIQSCRSSRERLSRSLSKFTGAVFFLGYVAGRHSLESATDFKLCLSTFRIEDPRFKRRSPSPLSTSSTL